MTATSGSAPLGRVAGAVLQVVAALFVTTLLLVGAELIASRFFPPHQITDLALPDERDSVSQTLAWMQINPAPLVPDADFLWRNEPLARRTIDVNPRRWGRRDVWRVENDSQGFRGPEQGPAVPGVYRILCIGDSVTFGYNADQPDTYPAQLERLLGVRHPGRPIEVLNTGVPGWSWLQGLRFLETEGLALDPDLVIIAHGTNDQILPATVTDEERFHRLGGPVVHALHRGTLLLWRTSLYRAVESFAPRREARAPVSPGCAKQIAEDGSCHRVSLDQIADAVDEVRRITERQGVDLLVVNLDFVGTRAVEGVRRGVARGGIRFLDAVERLDTLRQRSEDGRARRLGLALAHADPQPAPDAGAEAKPVRLRVVVPRAAGAYTVAGNVDFDPATKFSEPLYDDATHGDERAGDRVLTTTVAVRRNAAAVYYKYSLDGASELEPLPPLRSGQGERRVRLGTDTLGPVDQFGRTLFMAERAHPVRSGHAIVAKLVAAHVEAVDSFRRFVTPDPQSQR